MEPEPVTLLSLPLVVAHRVFLLLPADQRARCATVCRGWRALLADASLWTRLDLSDASGVVGDYEAGERVQRAAERACGQLRTLDVRRQLDDDGFLGDRLCELIRRNRDTLCELYLARIHTHRSGGIGVHDLGMLLFDAPKLVTLSAEVVCTVLVAPKLLRNEPPFGPLRMSKLTVDFDLRPDEPDEQYAESLMAALFTAVPLHGSLNKLTLDCPFSASKATYDLLFDGALAVKLSALTLVWSYITVASVSSLARLLRGDSLRSLVISGCLASDDDASVFDDPAATAVFADALRASTSLTHLELRGCDLWDADRLFPASTLLEALTGHPTIAKLVFDDSFSIGLDDTSAVGAAFGALVAANAPALHELYLSVRSPHDDDWLNLLCEALPLNAHIHTLDVMYRQISSATKQRLLAAVRASPSLVNFQTSLRDRRPNVYAF